MKRQPAGDLVAMAAPVNTGEALRRYKGKGGRPKQEDPPWVLSLRIHREVIELVRRAAKAEGLGIGEWAEKAFRGAAGNKSKQ